MAISPEEVRKMASLARLRLAPDEEERAAADLTRILDWVERLRAVDTEGVAPLAHVHDAVCPVREDAATGPLPVARATECAPETEGGAFVVPPVLGDGG